MLGTPYSKIDAVEDPSLQGRWLLDITEELWEHHPDLPSEMVNRAFESLVDQSSGGARYGSTRSAILGLIKRQLGWRIGNSQREGFEPDGSFTDHPAAALSLDLAIDSPEGGALGSLQDLVADTPSSRPEVIVGGRARLREILESAERSGLNALRAIIGEMVGATSQDISEPHGVEVATAYKWKSRFVILYRRRSEPLPDPRERSHPNRHS